MDDKCPVCGGEGGYPLGIITGNGEWTTIWKQCQDCRPQPAEEEVARATEERDE